MAPTNRDHPDAWRHLLAGPAPSVAPRLLGARLRCAGVEAEITEVEAYHGEDDRGCHASKGRTARTEVLYAEPGTLYIYLCYGIHHLLNLVCGQHDEPSAVLIRCIRITTGEAEVRHRRPGRGPLDRLTNGPGKVTAALALDRRANATRLGDPACPLHLLPPTTAPGPIRSGPRIGIDYAGPDWALTPWRWWLADMPVAPHRSRWT